MHRIRYDLQRNIMEGWNLSGLDLWMNEEEPSKELDLDNITLVEDDGKHGSEVLLKEKVEGVTEEEGNGNSNEANLVPTKSPRYTLTIIDQKLAPGTESPTCAVFLIPQGREHEWLFSTPEGLREILEGTDFTRMICVRLNHGHYFENMKAIQDELSPIVIEFAPQV